MSRSFNTPVNDQWKYFQTVVSCIFNSGSSCSAVIYYIILLHTYCQIQNKQKITEGGQKINNRRIKSLSQSSIKT